MANLNMNLSDYPELSDYQPLPPGEYPVAIVDSEIKENKNGEQQVVFLYEVQDGEHKGETVRDYLSLWSTNFDVQNFAQRRLKTIAIACGHKNPNFVSDTEDFHGHYMRIRTDTRKYNGKTYMDIKAYMPIDAHQAAHSSAPALAPHFQSAPNPQPVQTPPPSILKPWE